MAKSNRGGIFTDINLQSPGSNVFDLSHERKLSIKAGSLVPIMCMETVPGDRFHFSTSHLIRFAPLVAPVMHSVNVYTHFFFCPNRLVWDNWQDFITGGEDGEDTSVFPTCDLNFSTMSTGTWADYLGLPVGESANIDVQVSAMPIAMIYKIWDEYFRDQNLQNKVFVPLVDGDNPDYATRYNADAFKRAWSHDYFTSGLPWTQKGPEATIPLGTSARIVYQNDLGLPGFPGVPVAQAVNDALTGAGSANDTMVSQGGFLNQLAGVIGGNQIDVSASHYADLSTATASGIIDLRRAFKLQEWLELNARGGSRYIEIIKSHFNVNSSDARLQRPEFIGGGSAPVSFSEVLQTSDTTETTPQANMAGHGISVGQNGELSYFCEEHGYIIGFMSVMPKADYYQGIPKHFSKFDKFDYYWPSFAHIGEQAIQNKEIYITNNAETNEAVFAYTPRYAEYKYISNSIHGVFRTSLDKWHWARQFSSLPLLNSDFIQCAPGTRIFAVEGLQQEQLYCQVYNKVKAVRKMPYFGNPKM